MDQGPTLPGVEREDDEDRIVLHVDLDCFYAACERLREPALEGEPVVVGMGYEPGQPEGAVATASYEAREHGVESAQAISQALERLPRAAATDDADPDGPEERTDVAGAERTGGPGGAEARTDAAEETGDTGGGDPDVVGYYRPVDMEYYQSIAAEIKAILHDCAETVREGSVDEAYLDVTERTDWSVAEGYARHVKQRIDREVGLTASVGVAPTMHAAKVASDHDKPDGLVVVEPGEVRAFLAPLPVEELHGIGPVTAGELRGEGVETVADLAGADRDWLVDRWGERGGELHDRARGVDPRSVEPRGRPKSLSRESAFPEPQDDHGAVREQIGVLAAAVADRARSEQALYQTIGIKVVLPPYDVNTRARSLPGPVDDPELVESVALDLLSEFGDETPRKVGVRVSNLSFADADQSTLGGWDGRTEDVDASGGAAAGSRPDDGDAGDRAAGSDGDERTEPDGDEIRPEPTDEAGQIEDVGGSDGAVGASAEDGESSQGEETAVRAPDDPDRPGQSVLDRVWSDGPAEHSRPEPVGQPPEQTTLSEFE